MTAPAPVLLIVGGDLGDVGTTASTLDRRFGLDYRVLTAGSATDGLPTPRLAGQSRFRSCSRELLGAGKLGRTIRGFLVSLVVRQQARPSVKTQNRSDLIALKELVEAGQVRPVIGGTYPLGRTADAISQVAAGHARGTLVIAV